MIVRGNEKNTELRHEMRGGYGDACVQSVREAGSCAQKLRLLGEIVLNEGCSIGYHEHVGECEVFHILRGCAEVNDNGTVCGLEAGDYMLTPSGSSHSIACAGKERLVFEAIIVKD